MQNFRKGVLEGLGYVIAGNITQNHVPLGDDLPKYTLVC